MRKNVIYRTFTHNDVLKVPAWEELDKINALYGAEIQGFTDV